MATQLTLKNWRAALASGAPAIKLQPRYAVLGAAAIIIIVYLAMFASLHVEQRNQSAAETRYADASQLLEVPPVSMETLTAELEAARVSLSYAQGGAALTSIDPGSDAATALLVRRAQDAALDVTGIARLDSTEMRLRETAYDVNAIRISVQGESQEPILGFLQSLQSTDPGLIATLSSLAISEGGGAQAEIVFTVYSKVEATPVAGAPGVPQ